VKKIVCALAAVALSGVAWAGCSQSVPAVVVRSLEASGRAAFLCIHQPGAPNPGRQLDSCFTPGVTPGRYNYLVPHVIGLVTQTARGELAMVDVTSTTVLDADKSVPGNNFLPIGALPTDVVATPGGNAAFVGIGDPTRPGIFGIPSSKLPLMSDSTPPTFASWPACALPPGGVPTELVIVADTATSASDPGGRRAHCEGAPTAPAEDYEPTPGNDLTVETEMFGRLKLAVLLPELAEIDIIDAQELLSRKPGSFSPCAIERRVFLTVDGDLPPVTPPPDAGPIDAAAPDAPGFDDGAVSPEGGDAGASDGGELDASMADAGSLSDAGSGTSNDVDPDALVCNPQNTPCASPSLRPHPYALALSDDGRLFVSDDTASVIHVVDMRDPCEASEKAPLLPFSAADPSRGVISSAIAVSPLTSDGKRFVYASDVKNNGSLMVFDVSTTSTVRTPLLRPDRLFNPLEPPDRVLVPSPIESMTFVTHEIPLAIPDPNTGVIPRGVPCDPTNIDDPNRPPDDFLSSGAGPRRLRGIFAFLASANGELNVFDVDDLDVQCRRPRYSDDSALGCTETVTIPLDTGLPSASQEISCNVVERHRPRSLNFVTNADRGGRRAPAMVNFPVLYDKDGTALSNDPTRPGVELLPKLLGPSTEALDEGSRPLIATVLSSTLTPGSGGLSSNPNDEEIPNWVAFDLREPRAHATQVWTVTYEGTLPWFTGRRGLLHCADPKKEALECELGDNPSNLELHDSSVGFCDGGAQGEDLAPGGDILEITDNLPDPADPYWATAQECTRSDCEEVFGTLEAPRVLDRGEPIGRDIIIAKSYQGRLSLRPSATMREGLPPVPVACCFPYPVSYTVRARQQWIVTGQATGFSHRLIPNKNDTACMESGDPNSALRNGRVVARSPSEPVPAYDDPAVFRNAQLRFVIWDMDENCANPPCAARVRDRFFSFQEAGGFVAMRLSIAPDPVLPQSVRYVRGLQQLAITDPISRGLTLFSIGRLATVGPPYL
jgi:hypothetical protein